MEEFAALRRRICPTRAASVLRGSAQRTRYQQQQHENVCMMLEAKWGAKLDVDAHVSAVVESDKREVVARKYGAAAAQTCCTGRAPR